MWIRKTSQEIRLERVRFRRHTLLTLAALAVVCLLASQMPLFPATIMMATSVMAPLIASRRTPNDKYQEVFACDSCNCVRKGDAQNCSCGGDYVSLAQMKWQNPEPPTPDYFKDPIRIRG